LSDQGEWLARASYSPVSQIRARVWTFVPEEPVDRAFFQRKIRAAIRLRATVLPRLPEPAALRLIHSEADALPGLTVDRYGDFLVCQFLAAGVERHKSEIISILAEETGCRGVYERSDADARLKEGLIPTVGSLAGEEPPPEIVIVENGAEYRIDVRNGHKTGFYLDQRDNRAAAAAFAENREILNAFSYTCGFAVACLRAGAGHVTSIDSSADVLERGRRNLECNGIDASRHTSLVGDVFQELRRFRDARREFDMIILDPPKFADAKRNLDRALRGYRDINLFAGKLLRPGGILVTFSCSGLVGQELFRKVVACAVHDAERDLRIVRFLHQSADHPVHPFRMESEYLKGLVGIVERRFPQ
jgi:23S rRNA (cytosine1962-C5)-methyltransferase